MAIMGQGLVLLLTGMGIVYLFLMVLIVVTKYASVQIARFDSIFPGETPRKAPKMVASGDDAGIALAIAVAMG